MLATEKDMTSQMLACGNSKIWYKKLRIQSKPFLWRFFTLGLQVNEQNKRQKNEVLNDVTQQRKRIPVCSVNSCRWKRKIDLWTHSVMPARMQLNRSKSSHKKASYLPVCIFLPMIGQSEKKNWHLTVLAQPNK